MNYDNAFETAAAELTDLVKSKRRRARSESVAEMSDAKDYDDEDLDDFDRAPQGGRRKDMRDSNREWAGIQALDHDWLERDAEEIDLVHRMLVSGRPANIRFPGARGDSEITPLRDDDYVRIDDEDEDSDNLPEGRARIGGDRVARRALRSGRGVDDRYLRSKSLDASGMRRDFTSVDLIKSFNVIKLRFQEAMADEKLDPTVVLNYEGAFAEPRLGLDVNAAARALALVPPQVRKAYGIRRSPTTTGRSLGLFGAARKYRS